MGKRKSTIEILDPIHCKANPEARKLILPFLKYEKTFYKKSVFGGKQIISKCHLITGSNGTSGTFYTGLLPNIKKQLKQKNINIEIIGKQDKFKAIRKTPKLKNITFREKQLKAIKKFKIRQRGRIIFPTGYGKTITTAGIISIFSNLRIVFLCHTIDLINQHSKNFKKYDIDFLLLDGHNKIDWNYILTLDSVIVLSTIQSLSNVPKKYWSTFFDFVIIDETHHVTKERSQYGKLLKNILAPLRLGLTATVPTKNYEKLINEGLIGPIFSEITNEEGIKDGFLAKPKIKLIPIPFSHKINNKCKTYQEYVKYCLIKNKYRNKQIVNIVKDGILNQEIILIIVENINHGNELKKLLLKKDIKVPFIKGSMDRDNRINIKEKMEMSKQNVAICTKVWREGIDIPTITILIYAPGMKDEKLVKQAIGRGQRATENKDTITIIDFLDPYRYLAEHSIQRISIYIKEKWL